MGARNERWADGSYQREIRCPGGHGVRVVRVGEGLEPDRLDLVGMIREQLQHIQVRCGICGMWFGPTDQDIELFCDWVLQDIVDGVAWVCDAREYYGLRGTVERRLAAARPRGTR